MILQATSSDGVQPSAEVRSTAADVSPLPDTSMHQENSYSHLYRHAKPVIPIKEKFPLKKLIPIKYRKYRVLTKLLSSGPKSTTVSSDTASKFKVRRYDIMK